MKPVGVAPAIAIYQSLKTAGEELQRHDAGLEFGNVSRCHIHNLLFVRYKITRLGIQDKVIF